jgi:DNA-directed RNA polymerase specialized sigma24 family protein
LGQRKEATVPRRSPYTILLSNEELEFLEAAAARYTSPYFEVVRAKIVLYASFGMENQEIAERLDLPRQIVSKWRKRFFERRLEGLEDDPRTGRPPGFSPSRGRANKGSRV